MKSTLCHLCNILSYVKNAFIFNDILRFQPLRNIFTTYIAGKEKTANIPETRTFIPDLGGIPQRLTQKPIDSKKKIILT